MAAYGTDPGALSARRTPPSWRRSSRPTASTTASSARTLALVNGASLGEATRTPQGHEPTTAALVRTAVRMRNKLDDPNTAVGEQQSGPLPASAAGRMVA